MQATIGGLRCQLYTIDNIQSAPSNDQLKSQLKWDTLQLEMHWRVKVVVTGT